MKKSLIALAVLAASGAAMAQSSVTIYGLADIAFGSSKLTVGGNGVRDTFLDSGGVSTSRWGIKGSEDLGGGLKANFLLEQGFNIDNGAQSQAGQAFSRQSYVGLSGGFGEVKLGKVWTAFDDVYGSSNGVFDANALAPSKQGVFIGDGYNSNPANTIYYATPTFSGFSGAVSYSLGENKTATTDATSVTAFNVSYAAGPLAVQVGYQVEDFATANDVKYTRLGGSYDFGVVVAKASYGTVENVGAVSGRDVNEYQIGLDVPVTSALTVSGSYAHSEDDFNASALEQERKGYGIAATYTLSKRTFLYGGLVKATSTQPSQPDIKLTTYAVGVQHKF